MPAIVFTWWDKAEHAVAFAVLLIFGTIAYPTRLWLVIVGLILYGGGIEVAQTTTGWRYGDFWDWVADIVGVLLAAPFAALLIKHRLARLVVPEAA